MKSISNAKTESEMEANANNDRRINNFFLTVRKEAIDNRKHLLLRLVTLWGVFITMGGIWGYNYVDTVMPHFGILGFVALLFGAVVGAQTFSNMQTKTGRISALMLPASAADKFLVRWLAVVPLAFIALIAAFYLSELARILVALIHEGTIDADYARPVNLYSMLTLYGEPGGWKFGFVCLASYFMGQAFYILGSALWPSHSFAKTFVVLWALQMLLGMVVVPMRNIDFSFSFTGEDLAIWMGIGEIVLTIVLYYLAYLRFRRSQVVYKLF